MSSPWQLRTLGGLTLLRDGVAVSGAPAQRRRLALLAIIAAAGDRGYSREKLLAMLWPESDAESARHALSQLLFVVKRDLQCGELFMGGAELRLNPRELSSDVAELDRHVLGKDDAAAVALYGGPFLDGFHLRAGPEFERWQEEQRARLAKTYARALERLAAAAEARGDLLDAVGSRRRLAATDPLNTRLALALMRSLAASGDVAGALQHARLHETLLREELGVEADPAVVAFAAELRRRSADIETPRDTGPTRQSLGAEPASPSAVVLPAVTPVASRKRRSWLVGLAATIVAAIGVGALLASSRTSVHLDRNLIAVAPFEVLDPELTIWREGMMDVVSRALDGAGPLRAVPPSVVRQHWVGESDAASGVALGRATGARFVVLGEMLRSGRDSVRGTTMLISAETREVLAEREARDDVAHVDRLADSLAVTILRDIGVRQPVGAVRGRAFGGTSLPALKAFLRGEQLYRQSDMDSAVIFYQRAVELDSNFALALHQLSWTQQLQHGTRLGSSYSEMAYRAELLNHGLSRRDSLLVLLDSLRVAGDTNTVWTAPLLTVAEAKRMLDIARQAAGEYGSDADVLYQLGDTRLQFDVYLGTRLREPLADFDRAIASDSSFSPAYEHVVGIALDLQDTTLTARYLRAIRRHASSSLHGRTARILALLVNNARRDGDTAFVAIDTIPYVSLTFAFGAIVNWMDSAETAVRFTSYLLARARREAPTAVPEIITALAITLAERGHLEEAYAAYSKGGLEQASFFSQLAILGVVPQREARNTFAAWRAGGDALQASRAAPWLAMQRDTQSLNNLKKLAAHLRGTKDKTGVAPYVEWSVALYLALARSDTTAALAVCDAANPASVALRFLEGLDCGRLLVARGRYAEAERVMQPTTSNLGPIDHILRKREWGIAADLAGDHAAAREGFAYVKAAWRNPDARLAELVAMR